MNAREALAGLWRLAGLPDEALAWADLTGGDPVFPSSFACCNGGQATIAAAATGRLRAAASARTPRQRVAVDAIHAACECRGGFSIDGRVPDPWDKFSGLYRARDGWVRIHANFTHHRKVPCGCCWAGPGHGRAQCAEQALLAWSALDFEDAAAQAGSSPAPRALSSMGCHAAGPGRRAQPLLAITRVGEGAPREWPALRTDHVHWIPAVLDLTRILAGPWAAAHWPRTAPT